MYDKYCLIILRICGNYFCCFDNYFYWIEEYDDIIGSYFFYYIIGNCYLLRFKKNKLWMGGFVIKNMGLISKEYFC